MKKLIGILILGLTVQVGFAASPGAMTGDKAASVDVEKDPYKDGDKDFIVTFLQITFEQIDSCVKAAEEKASSAKMSMESTSRYAIDDIKSAMSKKLTELKSASFMNKKMLPASYVMLIADFDQQIKLGLEGINYCGAQEAPCGTKFVTWRRTIKEVLELIKAKGVEIKRFLFDQAVKWLAERGQPLEDKFEEIGK